MAESRPETTKCRKCGSADLKIFGDGSGYCLTCNDTFANFSEYDKFQSYSAQRIAGEQVSELGRQSPPGRNLPIKKAVAIAIVILMVSGPLIYYAVLQHNALPVSIHEISDLRGLEVLSEPSYMHMTEEELAGMLKESAADWDLLNETRILSSLFLLDPDEDLAEIYESSMAAGILGYYEPEEDRMVIIERQDQPEAMEKLTLAHEYTHALQDQHFNIGAGYLDANGWDQNLARRSLVEGDASLLEYEYYMNLAYAEQSAIYDYSLSMEGGETNYAVEQMRAFPYVYGYTFVDALHYVGGWSRVNSAYSDPPTTTEQIIHPQKYLTGERALDVQLNIQTPGMTLCVNESLGEFMVSTMLGYHLDEESVSDAAEGWGGDRFHYYSLASGDFLSVWKITWDTQEDCQEFMVAFNTMVNVLPPGYGDEFTSGLAMMATDGTSTTFYRASDPALISAILPECIG